MEKFAEGHAYTELYEVVKAVEAVANREIYRIEIVRNVKASAGKMSNEYKARYFRLETFNALPKYPRPGEDNAEPRDFRIWVEEFGYPSAYGPSAEIALVSALSKLEGGG